MDYPAPLERLQLNPHSLTDGDQCLLPDGTTATIHRSGFTWAKFKDHSPVKLAELHPYSPGDEVTSSRLQLTLF